MSAAAAGAERRRAAALDDRRVAGGEMLVQARPTAAHLDSVRRPERDGLDPRAADEQHRDAVARRARCGKAAAHRRSR
jgi:hypothetical protein